VAVVLGEVISMVGGAGFPLYTELSLLAAISDPEESHVHRFGFLLFDAIVAYPVRCGVISGDFSGHLRPFHVLKSAADFGAFLGIGEESGEFGFGFGGGRDNDSQDSSWIENAAIVGDFGIVRVIS
jgi:hypothetical protein